MSSKNITITDHEAMMGEVTFLLALGKTKISSKFLFERQDIACDLEEKKKVYQKHTKAQNEMA